MDSAINASPSGTVTSVATNTGTGITGGTITTSGTIAADTLLLSTRAWRQKGIDSVASLINTRISGTTNYIPKFTSSNAIGNSVIFESGGSIGIGTITPANLLSLYATDGNSYLRWTSNRIRSEPLVLNVIAAFSCWSILNSVPLYPTLAPVVATLEVHLK